MKKNKSDQLENKSSHVAIITAGGLGDGLIMTIATNYIAAPIKVTVFNKHMPTLSNWLPNITFKDYYDKPDKYLKYDRIILQFDNTKRAKDIKKLRCSFKKANISIFYPTYEKNKHGDLFETDFCFDHKYTMADNTLKACQNLFQTKKNIKNLNYTIPSHLQHKKHPLRIALHPFSGDIDKNWPLKKYIYLYEKLEKLGYAPYLISSIKDKDLLPQNIENQRSFEKIADLAAFIYESGFFIGNDSGPGHLASSLNIDSIIIANSIKKMRLWRPGWHNISIILPSNLLPNIKGCRLREEKGLGLISPQRIIKKFKSLLD